MKPDPAAVAARERLGSTQVLSLHLNGVMAAIRALIETHPDRDRVRMVFEQLIAQMLSHPGILDNPDQGIVIRDLAATLFQPPVEL